MPEIRTMLTNQLEETFDTLERIVSFMIERG